MTATATAQAASRGITIGTEVRGDLGRPGTDFIGRVVEIYAVTIEGFEVPAVKVETPAGATRYTLLGDVTTTRGEDDADGPRTPDEFAAMLGDVEAEAFARRLQMTATAVDTAQIAADVKAEIPVLLADMDTSGAYTAREMGIREWMLDDAEITHTDTSVTIRFLRGESRTAHFLGSALLERAADSLSWPVATIVENGDRTLTLQY